MGAGESAGLVSESPGGVLPCEVRLLTRKFPVGCRESQQGLFLRWKSALCVSVGLRSLRFICRQTPSLAQSWHRGQLGTAACLVSLLPLHWGNNWH